MLWNEWAGLIVTLLIVAWCFRKEITNVWIRIRNWTMLEM